MSLTVTFRALLGAMAGIAACLLFAAPAAAHTELLSSTPDAGSTLDDAPRAITLTFNEAVPARFTTVTLRVADRAVGALPVTNSDPDTVRAEVPDGLAADRATWVAAYRVTSGDGHPIEGEIRFTVRPDPAAQPAESPSEGQSPDTETATETPEATPESTPSSGDASAESTEASQSDRTPDVIATVVIGTLALVGTVLVLLVLTRGRAREDE